MDGGYHIPQAGPQGFEESPANTVEYDAAPAGQRARLWLARYPAQEHEHSNLVAAAIASASIIEEDEIVLIRSARVAATRRERRADSQAEAGVGGIQNAVVQPRRQGQSNAN